MKGGPRPGREGEGEPSMNIELLEEAAEYRLISLLLLPPEEGWEEEIRAISTEVQDIDLKNAASAACLEGNRGSYHTLFGPGGMVRARAVSHLRQLTPGGMLARLKGFYEAFAYNPGIKEPPDHVAVMTDFAAYLKIKQAMGHPRQARAAQEALVKFIREYLEGLALCTARDLEACGVNYLACAARALLRKVAAVKEATGGAFLDSPSASRFSPPRRLSRRIMQHNTGEKTIA